MKDNFSAISSEYTQFRPGYPNALIDFLINNSANHNTAWDCGTGNGQLATQLAPHFKKVIATDISENQLKHAKPSHNIQYLIQEAGKSDFAENSFDLITVAQAIHWFAFETFYEDVFRCLKPGGLFAAIGYYLPSVNAKVDAVIGILYNDILGKFWDSERRFVDDRYRTIPFPFEEIPCPEISQVYNWNIDQLLGFLGSWSAVRHYVNANGIDPVLLIEKELEAAWGVDSSHEVKFPIILRAGRLPGNH